MIPIIGTLLIVAVIVGPLFIVIMGWGQTQARQHLAIALEDLEKGNFEVARRRILTAARLDRRTLRSNDIKILYELVIQRREIPDTELDRYADIVKGWPQSRPEFIWGHPLTKVLFFAIIVLGMLSKLLVLLGE